jgi:hypothetical protein
MCESPGSSIGNQTCGQGAIRVFRDLSIVGFMLLLVHAVLRLSISPGGTRPCVPEEMMCRSLLPCQTRLNICCYFPDWTGAREKVVRSDDIGLVDLSRSLFL